MYTLKMKVKVDQSCPTLCNPMDNTVRGILQARILEWIAFAFSRESLQESNWGLLQCRRILYQLSYEGSPNVYIALCQIYICIFLRKA